ncbi:protein YgfX [Methylophaga pinxianii]|uniref:protein YgfX n=1 Tax=Methylophaga pinxianii TaxID=2881052 RepID=UPI001CF488B0|nr:protein YgfX [Methylophaga pinxianii]MCB2427433.1 hypothetical protein [Methylophaga pinxianii]UPH45162.1 hypothetical protein LGT42_011660 [Methylophaga pinxianii]
MQEKGFYLPLTRSRTLVVYSLLVHILAVISILLCTLSLTIKVLLAVIILISQLSHLYRLGFISDNKKRPVAVLNPAKEYWQIRYADQTVSSDLLLERAWVTRLAVILHFQSTNKNRMSLLIVKDAATEEQFRQLRVRIRLAFFQQ